MNATLTGPPSLMPEGSLGYKFLCTIFSFLFFKSGSLTGLNLIKQCRLASQRVPGKHFLHLSHTAIISISSHACSLLCDFWGSNPGPHACKANTLSMRPSPNPSQEGLYLGEEVDSASHRTLKTKLPWTRMQFWILDQKGLDLYS